MRAISDEAVKALINSGISTDTDADREYVCECIDNIPTIEPKRGEWISKDPHWHTAICSNCNKVTMFEEWDEEVIEYDFCPNCGADMREREGE